MVKSEKRSEQYQTIIIELKGRAVFSQPINKQKIATVTHSVDINDLGITSVLL